MSLNFINFKITVSLTRGTSRDIYKLTRTLMLKYI